MSSKAVRSKKNSNPYDAFDGMAKLVNFGAVSDIGKFNTIPENVDNDSIKFTDNTYLTDGQYNLDMVFVNIFSISFWAKFPATERGKSDLSNTRFILILDDETKIEHIITNPDNLWHHYSIVRESNGRTTMRIDGVTVETPIITSAALNLSNNSYIYLGDNYKYYEGYDVIVDDLCVVDGVLWTRDFDSDLPTDYLDLSKFKHYLYVVVGSGEVWGYVDS